MKRFLTTLLVVAALLPVVAIGSLNITVPNSTTSWAFMDQEDITWTWSGDYPSYYIIEWIENEPGCRYWIPVDSVAGNTMSYEWDVGACIDHLHPAPFVWDSAQVKIRAFDSEGRLTDSDISDYFTIYNY